eukprot:3292293-Prymnesium_polylepis.1
MPTSDPPRAGREAAPIVPASARQGHRPGRPAAHVPHHIAHINDSTTAELGATNPGRRTSRDSNTHQRFRRDRSMRLATRPTPRPPHAAPGRQSRSAPQAEPATTPQRPQPIATTVRRGTAPRASRVPARVVAQTNQQAARAAAPKPGRGGRVSASDPLCADTDCRAVAGSAAGDGAG